MPRPRAFDDDAVLDAAISCFWHRGLEATSIRELTDTMGINAPSLYNAFGDKRQLFMRSLERYANLSMRARLGRLAKSASPREALTTFFRDIITRSCDDPERRGCMIINTALEVAPHDPEIGRLVNGYLGEIEASLRDRVAAAQSLGECDPAIDAAATGRMLLGLLVGVRVLSRTGAPKAMLEDMLQPAFVLLHAGETR